MKLKNEAVWKEGLQNNQDAYGAYIYRYAERWADLMESKMAAGEKLEDIAEKTSHEADTEGITGYMYGAAVSVLSWTWEHGEALRKWHNRKYKQPDAKGIVNPAILVVKG